MDMDVSVCAYGHFLYGPWTYLSRSLSLSLSSVETYSSHFLMNV
jgi:hypothetical protein